MIKKFEYKYDEETHILFKFYYGKITLKDIENSWIYAFENFLIPLGTKKYILDYRNSFLDIEIKETSAISDFLQKNLTYFKDSRIAVIMEKPRQIVYPNLVMKDDKQYKTRPFTSMEAAIEWVLM